MALRSLFSPCRRLIKAAVVPVPVRTCSILSDALQLAPADRIQRAVELSCDPSLTTYKRLDICEQIADSVLLLDNVSWDVLLAVRQATPLLRMLRDGSSRCMGLFADNLLQSLQNRSEASVEDLISAIMLVSYVHHLSPLASERFIRAERLFLPKLGDIKRPFTLLRLLRIFTQSLRNATVSPEMAIATVKSLATIMGDVDPSYLLGGSSKSQTLTEGLLAAAELGVRNEQLLDSVVSVFARFTETESPDDLTYGMRRTWNLVKFFSLLRYPAPSMFALTSTLISRAELSASPNHVNAYVEMWWAYMAQDQEPPSAFRKLTANALEQALREQPNLTFKHVLFLEQISAYLPDIIGLDSCIRRSRKAKYTFSLRMASEVQVRHPIIAMGIHRPEGFILLATLVDPCSSELLEWPDMFGPMDVTKENAATLPGVPVALLIEEQSLLFAEPKGMFNGILHIKCQRLKDAGWAVAVQTQEDLTHELSWGKDYVSSCITAMQQAALQPTSAV